MGSWWPRGSFRTPSPQSSTPELRHFEVLFSFDPRWKVTAAMECVPKEMARFIHRHPEGPSRLFMDGMARSPSVAWHIGPARRPKPTPKPVYGRSHQLPATRLSLAPPGRLLRLSRAQTVLASLETMHDHVHDEIQEDGIDLLRFHVAEVPRVVRLKARPAVHQDLHKNEKAGRIEGT